MSIYDINVVGVVGCGSNGEISSDGAPIIFTQDKQSRLLDQAILRNVISGELTKNTGGKTYLVMGESSALELKDTKLLKLLIKGSDHLEGGVNGIITSSNEFICVYEKVGTNHNGLKLDELEITEIGNEMFIRTEIIDMEGHDKEEKQSLLSCVAFRKAYEANNDVTLLVLGGKSVYESFYSLYSDLHIVQVNTDEVDLIEPKTVSFLEDLNESIESNLLGTHYIRQLRDTLNYIIISNK